MHPAEPRFLRRIKELRPVARYAFFLESWVVGFAMGGELAHVTLKSSLILGYLVLNSSVAYTLWSVLLKYNRVGMVSVFNFLVPIFGAMLSAIFLGETLLEWKNLLALLLVCGGIWLVTLEKQGNHRLP